jgi:hypothetical protein
VRVTDEALALIRVLEVRQGDGAPEVARSWTTVHIAGVERWIQEAVDLDPDRGGGVGSTFAHQFQQDGRRHRQGQLES